LENDFKAVSARHSKNAVFDENGVFALGCARHEIPTRFFDIKFGEGHKYALAAVGSELARTNNTEMYVMYDIACFLAKKLEKRTLIHEEFNKWKRSRAIQQYWINRKNVQDQNDQTNGNNDDSSTEATNVTATSLVSNSTTSMSRSSSSSNSIETITVYEAKDLIKGSYINTTNSNSITNYNLLSYEPNLQQLLALSNVLLIGKNTYDTKLDNYFTTTTIDTIRKHVFDSLKLNHADQKGSKNIVVDLMITILDFITENMDPILVKLLLSFKTLVEALPSNKQQKKSLFDGDEDNRMIFKWVNTIAFSDNRNDDHPAVTKNRPDDCVENDSRTIGFMEVKTIDNAANHHKINVDMYSLGDFGKNALSQYGLNKTFQVMAIGTSLHFYICQNVEDVRIMTELNSLRIPTSFDELF
ncbi:hypothetical protein CU098_006927, partial [Rhizopus stolonifer]